MKNKYISLVLLSIFALQNNIFSMEKDVAGSREKTSQLIELLNKPNINKRDLIVMFYLIVNKHNRADVNAKGDKGNTVLMYAVRLGDKDMVKSLISQGADVNVTDNDSYTVLMKAVTSGNTDIVKLLMQAGADINAKTNNGYTALRIAVFFRHLDVIKLLIHAGIDVNAKFRNFGDTPIVLAVKNVGLRSDWDLDIDLIKLLISQGADVDAVDDEGLFALGWAQLANLPQDILDLLEDPNIRK